MAKKQLAKEKKKIQSKKKHFKNSLLLKNTTKQPFLTYTMIIGTLSLSSAQALRSGILPLNNMQTKKIDALKIINLHKVPYFC